MAQSVVPMPREAQQPGRPRTITPQIAEGLLRAFGLGYSVADACAIVGVGKSTFYRHCQEFREFRDAAYRARQEALLGLTEKALAAVDVAAAKGDWRALITMVTYLTRRMDQHRVEEMWHVDPRSVPPEKVAEVVRILQSGRPDDREGDEGN